MFEDTTAEIKSPKFIKTHVKDTVSTKLLGFFIGVSLL